MIYKPEGAIRREYKGIKIETLYKFMEEGRIVEAPVSKCDREMNIHIDLGKNVHGIIPYREFEYNNKEPKSGAIISKVGKVVCFKVVGIREDTDGRIDVELSRRLAQEECYREYIENLKPGKIIDAKVVNAEDYGIFCDIGCGITALLPIKNLCTTRIENAKKELNGKIRKLKVLVKEINNGRIILTHRELLGTWEEEAARFNVGETVTGVVRKVEDYGVFIEISPNLAGLAEANSSIKEGESVSVCIKAIIPDKMKVKLNILGKTDTRYNSKFQYRIPEDKELKYWRYSPSCCSKIIETIIK